MANTDEVFQLIKSLNKNEKRTLKLTSRITKGEKSYIRIFDAIDKMDVYDGKIFGKTFKDSGLNLSYEKNYLQGSILKMLRNNPAEGACLQPLLLAFSEAEALFGRGLFKMALAKIEKAKIQAAKYEFFGVLYDLLNSERKVLLLARENNAVEQQKKWKEEFADARAKQNNLSSYIEINHDLHALGISHGAMIGKENLAKMKKIVSTALMSNEKKAMSVTALMLFFNHKLSYFDFSGNVDKALKYSTSMYELYNRSMLIEKSPQNYISVLANHIILLSEKKRFKEAMDWLKKLDVFPESHKMTLHSYLSVWKFQLAANIRLNLCLEAGDFTEGIKSIPSIKNEIKKYAASLSGYYKIVFQYHFALMYFGDNKQNECIRELQDLINDNGNAFASDYKSYAKIILMMCHYEKGNTEILPYLYKQLKLSEFNGIQKEIVQFIMEDSKPGSFIKTFKNHSEYHVAQNYINFHAWLKSKVEGISFGEATRRLNGIPLKMKLNS